MKAIFSARPWVLMRSWPADKPIWSPICSLRKRSRQSLTRKRVAEGLPPIHLAVSKRIKIRQAAPQILMPSSALTLYSVKSNGPKINSCNNNSLSKINSSYLLLSKTLELVEHFTRATLLSFWTECRKSHRKKLSNLRKAIEQLPLLRLIEARLTSLA